MVDLSYLLSDRNVLKRLQYVLSQEILGFAACNCQIFQAKPQHFVRRDSGDQKLYIAIEKPDQFLRQMD